MSALQEHSPLGGSGVYRWQIGTCPASPRLSAGVADPESDYAAEGSAAHGLAAYCLSSGEDAWQSIGARIKGDDTWPRKIADQAPEDAWEVTQEMADAVQVYLDAARREHPDRNQGNTWIERPFHCPEVHELMYGTPDLCHLEWIANASHPDFNGSHPVQRLHVWDYKHGAGIVVEVEHNPQLMYYAVGALTDLDLWDAVEEVVLWIAQPRGWMEPVRSWRVSVAELVRWRDEVLVPSMTLCQTIMERDDISLDQLLSLGFIRSGADHCRFCPARYRACPALVRDMEQLEEIMTEAKKVGTPALTNEQVGKFLTLGENAKVFLKAARETGFQRAEKGAAIPGWKLAKAKSDRVWKDGAEKKAKAKFKGDCMTPPKLLSPAQLEKLPGGPDFVAKNAYKPDKGNTLVPETDARQAAGPAKKAMFEPVGKEKKGRKK